MEKTYNIEEAAEYLGYTVGTMKVMRAAKNGPRFAMTGATRYFQSDLDAWFQELRDASRVAEKA